MIRRLFCSPPPAIGALPQVEVVNEGLHSAEVYHDAARHFLDVQISTMDMLDSKTAQYLSAASLALPVTAALLSFGVSGRDGLSRPAFVALTGALVCYVLVLVFSAAASMIRGLEYRPDISTVKQHSEAYAGIFLRQWVANEYEASIVENKKVLVAKARWVGAEALAFYLEGLCLSIAAAAALLL